MEHTNDTKVQQKRPERVPELFKHDGSPERPGYYSAYRASGTVKYSECEGMERFIEFVGLFMPEYGDVYKRHRKVLEKLLS